MVREFIDDEDGYRGWVYSNPGGYVLNADRHPKPDYLVLHRAMCDTISPRPDASWTKSYIKVCSTNCTEVELWARARRRLGDALH